MLLVANFNFLLKKSFFIKFFLISIFFSDYVKANYWLIIGTYRLGQGDRPKVD